MKANERGQGWCRACRNLLVKAATLASTVWLARTGRHSYWLDCPRQGNLAGAVFRLRDPDLIADNDASRGNRWNVKRIRTLAPRGAHRPAQAP